MFHSYLRIRLTRSHQTYHFYLYYWVDHWHLSLSSPSYCSLLCFFTKNQIKCIPQFYQKCRFLTLKLNYWPARCWVLLSCFPASVSITDKVTLSSLTSKLIKFYIFSCKHLPPSDVQWELQRNRGLSTDRWLGAAGSLEWSQQML